MMVHGVPQSIDVMAEPGFAVLFLFVIRRHQVGVVDRSKVLNNPFFDLIQWAQIIKPDK